ncbi:MAG: hypothetical protein K9H25_21755 [Rhodospirillum sp.]|nr:hypothetical protein [Rhodospirillum sp.]MCF8491164.1 hypothetical protein [Rhodospirillum sp.]MCF8502667.1 hypothetical protein [Rhodospirillum sp.]
MDRKEADLEIAMKGFDSSRDRSLTLPPTLKADSVTFWASNPNSALGLVSFRRFRPIIESRRPNGNYTRIPESASGESGGSGLGLVAMINDYSAGLDSNLETEPANRASTETKASAGFWNARAYSKDLARGSKTLLKASVQIPL